MKKLVSLILTLCIMLTVCSAGSMTICASAVEKINGSDVTWSFDFQTKTLTFGGKGSIPNYDTYEDEDGNSTIPWAGCDFNTVEFGSEITGIGNYALRKSVALVAVIIPETVTKIGTGAFSNCLALRSVTIKKGITEISEKAFSGCTALSTVELPDGITKIGASAFYKCSSIKNISLPDSVKIIDVAAFNSCTALESFKAPTSLQSIGERAFHCCENLAAVALDGNVFSIGNRAFYRCTGLKTITLGENMSFLGESAFDGCTSLTEITLPAGIQKISGAMFSGCSSLKKVLIPEGIKSIEANAFLLCPSLLTVRIPYSVETIGSGAFGYGSRGKLVEGFTIIGYDGSAAQKYAADNSLGFTSLGDPLAKSGKISENLSWEINDEGILSFVGSGEIPDYSLYDMPVYYNSEVNVIIVDKNITKLGAYSLLYDFESFYVSQSVTSIGKKAIGYHFNEKGKVVKNEGFGIIGYKDSAAEKYAKANGFEFFPIVSESICGEKATWKYDADSKKLTVSGEGKISMYYDESTMPCFFIENCDIDTVEIGEGITEIDTDAFTNITNNDQKITFRIPKSVTSIADYAIGYSECYVADEEDEENVELAYIPNTHCVIEGYEASEAQRYAEENEFEFVALEPIDPPPADKDTTFKLSDKASVCLFDEESKIIKIYDDNATSESILADFIIGKDVTIGEIAKIATGETLKTTCDFADLNTYTLALIGDVNGDGKINSSDALLVLRHSVALDSLTGVNLVASDLDLNGSVNSADALRILRISVGLEKLSDLYPKAEKPAEPESK